MLRINFTGDISFTGVFAEKVANNAEIFSNDIKRYVLSSDFNVCNFEGAATDRKNVLGREFDVKSPLNSVEYLKKRGFYVFGCANNHIFDSGRKGWEDTRRSILEQKCKFFGAGENIEEASDIIYLEKNNIKVALIGVCHKEGMIADARRAGVFCDRETDLLIKKVKEARENANWVILNYHGGGEYTTFPMPRKRKLLKNFIKYGVDIIVAHHPHVFQGYERDNKSIIFYSLGNFIFDIKSQRLHEFTDESAILNIQFSQNDFSFDFHPTKIDLANGLISRASKEKFNDQLLQLLDFDNYVLKWRKDAYRVFFQLNVNTGVDTEFEKNTLRNKNKLLLIFIPKTYFSLCRILKGSNSRAIFLSAIAYKILKKLRFRNYSKRDK